MPTAHTPKRHWVVETAHPQFLGSPPCGRLFIPMKWGRARVSERPSKLSRKIRIWALKRIWSGDSKEDDWTPSFPKYIEAPTHTLSSPCVGGTACVSGSLVGRRLNCRAQGRVRAEGWGEWKALDATGAHAFYLGICGSVRWTFILTARPSSFWASLHHHTPEKMSAPVLPMTNYLTWVFWVVLDIKAKCSLDLEGKGC